MQILAVFFVMSIMGLILFGSYIALLLKWIIHTHRRTQAEYRRLKHDVWIELDPTTPILINENLRFKYVGSIERFVIKRHSDTHFLGEETGYVYAVFGAAKQMKHVKSPGVLTYYYYDDKMFFANFEPYSTEQGELHFPKIERLPAERNYLIILWTLLFYLISMLFVFLFVVVPKL